MLATSLVLIGVPDPNYIFLSYFVHTCKYQINTFLILSELFSDDLFIIVVVLFWMLHSQKRL